MEETISKKNIESSTFTSKFDNDGSVQTYMQFDPGEVQQKSSIEEIRFDFNYGVRVTVPQGEYRVKFIDRKSCLTVYDAPASGVMVTSSKKYFVDFRIEIYEKENLIFAHDLDLKEKKVLIKFPTGIL